VGQGFFKKVLTFAPIYLISLIPGEQQLLKITTL
jgi:hypothetical protein